MNWVLNHEQGFLPLKEGGRGFQAEVTVCAKSQRLGKAEEEPDDQRGLQRGRRGCNGGAEAGE